MDLDQPTGVAPAAATGRQLEVRPSIVMVWSRATLQRYLKTRQRSGRTSPGTGRQAATGSAGGTAKRALKRGRNEASSSLAAARSATPASHSSTTSRSWNVPQSRSIRPLPCAERATMEPMPSSSSARPTWLSPGGAPGSVALGEVGAKAL